MSTKKNFILPMALASFCVEQVSASLACKDGVSSSNQCNPYGAAFVEPELKVANKTDVKAPERSSDDNSLYNRNISKQQDGNDKEKSSKKSSAFNKKIEPSASIKPKDRPKQILRKVKDIKISSLKDTAKVSKNRVATLKTYKKVIQKIKQNQETTKISPKVALRLKMIDRKLSRKNFYIAQQGDTLRTIAKKTKTPISKLVKLNSFYKDNHIEVGQKIYYDGVNGVNSFKKIKKTETISKNKIGNRVLKVTATAYTSHSGQTDKTPFLAAWNNRIKPGMKIIAVSRDLIEKYKLTNGVKVKIKGFDGIFTVRDKMNKRFKKRIDIYMGTNKHKALKFGKQELTLVW